MATTVQAPTFGECRHCERQIALSPGAVLWTLSAGDPSVLETWDTSACAEAAGGPHAPVSVLQSPEWVQGYRQQMDWLTRKGTSVPGADNALRSRVGTLTPDGGYNDGGTQATRDYMARMRAAYLRALACSRDFEAQRAAGA